MREIRFRAWNSFDKEMIYLQSAIHDSWGLFVNRPDEYTIMQFTGLYDKNGKEIYEGDILKSGWLDKNVICQWKDKYAGFYIDVPGFSYNFSYNKETAEVISLTINPENIEIIGNIHENPELIEDLK